MTDTSKDAVDRLEAQLRQYADHTYGAHKSYKPEMAAGAADTLRALMAELDALREALEPFAKCSETYPDAKSTAHVGFGGVHDARCPLTIGDYHRARAALSQAQQPISADAHMDAKGHITVTPGARHD